MANRNNTSFSAADQRVWVVNGRINTFDFNTEQIRIDLSNNFLPLLNDINNNLESLSVDISGGITGSVNLTQGITGSVNLTQGITGSVNLTQGITGSVNLTQGITGSVNLTQGITGSVNLTQGITGSVNLTQGITGSVNLTQGITGSVNLTQGITGSVNLTEGITGQVKLTEGITGQVKLTEGITGSVNLTQGITGSVNLTQGITGQVKLTEGITGQVKLTEGITGQVKLTEGITGSVNLTQGITGSVNLTQGITGSVNLTQGITGSVNLTEGITGSVYVSNLPGSLLGITGNLSTSITPGTLVGLTGSAYNLLDTIETDISSGILVKGTDDTGARNNFYVDVNGIQRTFVYSQKNLETAKYVWELDINVITTSPIDWILDGRDREGWYFIGSSSDTLSWYANSISSPPIVHFNKVQALWFIATIDNTSPTVTMRVVTASSVWAYTLPSGSTYFNGEKYLFYYGNKAITEHPELQAVPLTRSLISGPGANNENVTAINIVTGTSDGLLLNSCGMYNQDLTQKFETVFRDIRAQTAEDQLISLDFSGTNLNTVVNNPLRIEGKRYASSTAFEQVSVQEVGSFFPPLSQIALRTLSTICGRYWDGVTGYTNSELPVSVSITSPIGLTQRQSMSTTVDNSVSLVSGQIVGVTGSISINANQFVGITGNVGISTSANTIKFDPSNNSIKINDGTNTASVLPSVSNLKNYNGLVTDSTLYGLHVATGDVFPVTTDISGNRVQIEVRDNEAVAELTSIDNKIIQGYNTTNNSISGYNSNNVALSTYVIPSKTKSFKFSAFTANTATNAFIGSINSSTTFSNTNFGLANSRQFYVIRSGTTSAALSLAIDYIDALGNEQAAVVAAPIATTLTAITGVNGITINSVRANQTYTTNDTVSIAYANNINTSFAGGNFYQNNNSLFTCPNNAIAWVQNVSFYGQAADNLRLFKWTTQGVRETIYGWTNQTNFNASSSGEYGFGGYITAGETVGWGGENSSTSKVLYSTVIVKYF